MGPVSQGSMNDLSVLSGLISALSDNKKLDGIIQNIKMQMDEVNAKGAEVSQLEASIKKREAGIGELEAYAKAKKEDSDEVHAEYLELLGKYKVSKSEVDSKQKELQLMEAEWNAKCAAKEKELNAKEEDLKAKKTKVDELLTEAESLKTEYEEKMKQLKQIVV